MVGTVPFSETGFEISSSHRFARYRGLALAVAAAAVLQGLLVARSPTVTADGIIFTAVARSLAQAPIETFRVHDQHPGYPAMMLAGTQLVRFLGYRLEPESWMAGGQLVAFICGLLSVIVVWLLARDMFDTRVADLAAFVFAMLPLPRWTAADALSDTPHLLFYLLAVWLASSAISSGQLLRLAGAGAASAIAYWIRPEGLAVFLIALPCLVWQAFRAGWTWRHLGAACATLAGVTLLIAAPYPILAGKFTSKQLRLARTRPTQTYIAKVVAADSATVQPPIAQPTTLAAPVSAPQSSAPELRRAAALALRVFGKAVAALVNSLCQGLKFVFIPFFLIGQIGVIRRQQAGLQMAFLALLAATHIIVLLAVYVNSGYIAHRHVLPLVALAMPCTGLGILYTGEWAAARLRIESAKTTLASLALGCLIVLPYSLRPFSREFVPVIAATRWVQARAEPGSGIICNSPYVGYYGSLPVTYLTSEAPTLADALAKATVAARYDYVVLHVNAHDYHPEWIDQIERQFRRVEVFPDLLSDPARNRKVLVFEAKRLAASTAQPAHR
jgi:hypothetical protein